MRPPLPGPLSRKQKNFNPRTPCGVRPACTSLTKGIWAFQSTHPLRGATKTLPEFSVPSFSISIHAPLAGCDEQHADAVPHGRGISIHAPLAGCDVLARLKLLRGSISIHAPLAGCDKILSADGTVKNVISIHAPLAGCDRFARSGRCPIPHFNPRTPCGVRQERDGVGIHLRRISIHAPLAGCDAGAAGGAPEAGDISIHAPLAGCDRGDGKHGERVQHFNPRTPCGVRLESC